MTNACLKNTRSRHIAVDLDGTLINTDMLMENILLYIRHHPWKIFSLFRWVLNGKAYFKQRLADVVLPDVECLPYNHSLLCWLKEQRKAGSVLILATASDIRIAQSVANHLGIFDEVIGTQEQNLSSHHKQQALISRFGEKGFVYIGNSTSDLPVWKSATEIYVANPGKGVLAAAQKLGVVSEVFDERPSLMRTILRALRFHQWSKNILIFIPLLASHRFLEWPLVWSGVMAFIAFGACASSVYMLNDLLDLPDDRLHPTKRLRPIAAGTLPILHALFLVPTLLVVAFALALWKLPPLFAVVLACYYLLTLAYSLWLKRIVMLDVVTLAMLYTTRIIAGAGAMALATTFWILAFSMFIFLSLAFLKRYTELHDARLKGKKDKSAGRGYYPADYELLASLGGASGYLSVLVLALYINEAASATLYRSPEWMWAACPLLLYWLSRAWLLAHRGQMHDDPIVFALRDNVSLLVGIGFLAVFALATL